MTDIGVNRNYNLDTYHADTVNDPYFQEFSQDLIDKAWNKYQDYKTNKAQYFVNENIINGTQEGKNYYAGIEDKEKSKILFHDYLHWCSSMKRDPNVSFEGQAGGPTDENGNYYTFAHPRVIAKDAWEIWRTQRLDNDLEQYIAVPLDGYHIDSFDKWQRYANVREDNNPSIFVQFYKGNLLLALVVDSVVPDITIETNTSHYFFFLYNEETRIKNGKNT